MARSDRHHSPCTWGVVLALAAAFCAQLASSGEGPAGSTAGRPAPPAAAVRHTAVSDADVAAARQRIISDPASPSARVHLGYVLIKTGALDDAMASFDEALKLNPLQHDAMTGRGVALARAGRLQEAEQSLLEALKLNPNPVRAHYELGRVYEMLGDQEKALVQYKEAIRKHEQGR